MGSTREIPKVEDINYVNSDPRNPLLSFMGMRFRRNETLFTRARAMKSVSKKPVDMGLVPYELWADS